jgi:hypothetical protein
MRQQLAIIVQCAIHPFDIGCIVLAVGWKLKPAFCACLAKSKISSNARSGNSSHPTDAFEPLSISEQCKNLIMGWSVVIKKKSDSHRVGYVSVWAKRPSLLEGPAGKAL